MKPPSTDSLRGFPQEILDIIGAVGIKEVYLLVLQSYDSSQAHYDMERATLHRTQHLAQFTTLQLANDASTLR